MGCVKSEVPQKSGPSRGKQPQVMLNNIRAKTFGVVGMEAVSQINA